MPAGGPRALIFEGAARAERQLDDRTWGIAAMPSARLEMLVLMLLGAIPGCSTMNAYSNQPLVAAEIEPEAGPRHAELRPVWDGNPKCFQRVRPLGPDILALTISCGGSRAAVLGAAVMLELQEIGALGSVDLISSVSGGSLPAALYALSRDSETPPPAPDQDDSRRLIWQRDDVMSLAGADCGRSGGCGRPGRRAGRGRRW